MSTLSLQQIIQYIQQAGFSGQGLQNAAAVVLAESGGDPGAKNSNGPTPGCPGGSVDRGLFQINDCYHSEVSNSCAFDPACAAKAAFTISNSGTDFSPWSTFKSGKYQQFINQVQSALGSSNTSNTTPSSSSSTSSSNVCDVWIIGGLICSTWFEQAVIVLVGILLALVALVIFAAPEAEKIVAGGKK